MNIRTQSFKLCLIAVLVMLLSSLACSIDFGSGDDNEDVSLQQTMVALQMTQSALENLPPDEPTPTEEPADPPTVPDFEYDGVSFSFNSAIANNISAITVPEQNMGEDYMPSDTYPTHIEINFDGYSVPEHFHTPVIRVYPIDEYRAISPFVSEGIDSLARLLSTQSREGLNTGLPFLPFFPAAQFFTAKVEYIDFQNGAGVRYLTMFGQALSPVDNQNLFYTYQGITNDGKFYISAILPVSHNELPNDGYSQVDDWNAFGENWETYLAETLVWLEAQSSNTFNPNLDHLDAMITSFSINK